MKRPDLFALSFFLFVLCCFPSVGRAADAESSSATPIMDRIKSMDKRLEKIEADQATVLENQKEILEQLQHLKVLVRRS